MSEGAYFCLPGTKPKSINGHQWPMLLTSKAGQKAVFWSLLTMTIVHIPRCDNLKTSRTQNSSQLHISQVCISMCILLMPPAHAVRTHRSPGETDAVNLPMNTCMHVQNAQHILAASSSFCMHTSWVPEVFGTPQECLGKNMRVLLADAGLGYAQRSWDLNFQILVLPDRSYLSQFGSDGFPVVRGLQTLFLTRCPLLDLKKHCLMNMFSEILQR